MYVQITINSMLPSIMKNTGMWVLCYCIEANEVSHIARISQQFQTSSSSIPHTRDLYCTQETSIAHKRPLLHTRDLYCTQELMRVLYTKSTLNAIDKFGFCNIQKFTSASYINCALFLCIVSHIICRSDTTHSSSWYPSKLLQFSDAHT